LLPRTHEPESICACFQTPHRSTLQHIARPCNTLQHTATHCNTTHCNALQHTATLQHTRFQLTGLTPAGFREAFRAVCNVESGFYNLREGRKIWHIYTHTCVYKYMCMNICIYVQVFICIYAYMYMDICIYVYVYFSHAFMCACVFVCVCLLVCFFCICVYV